MVRITAIPLMGFLGLVALTTGAFASVGGGVNSNQNGNSLQGLTQYAQVFPGITTKNSSVSSKKKPKPPPVLPWCKKGEEKKAKQKKCKVRPNPYTPK